MYVDFLTLFTIVGCYRSVQIGQKFDDVNAYEVKSYKIVYSCLGQPYASQLNKFKLYWANFHISNVIVSRGFTSAVLV